jgi:hypothetical protein
MGGSFYGLSHDAMVEEYVIYSAHNSSFYLSYFMAQEVSVASRVSTTR